MPAKFRDIFANQGVDDDGVNTPTIIVPLHGSNIVALSGGKGSWGAQLKVDPNTVVGARLTSDQGTVLASASFDPVYPATTQGPK